MEEFINLPRRTSLTKSGGEQNQWLCIIGGTGGSVQINGVCIDWDGILSRRRKTKEQLIG